ncbi:MAG TPA: hypothetical protein VJX67_16890 [Blastocatellia bacterium]|nr:hypothetical protein [Blastocatellia bacterium]
MTPTDKSSRQSSPSRAFTVSYTQGDVDTLREQIEQDEASKRRLLRMALLVTAVALAGVVVLLTTTYSLYAKSQSARQKLSGELAAVKSQSAQCAAELGAIKASEARDAQTRSDAEARLRQLLPAALSETGEVRDVAALAQTVYSLPDHAVQIERKPPNTMFKNWKVRSGEATSVYTLVGGFVDGKWVIYSNLVSRRPPE